MTKAAITGDYSDLKFIKSRKVAVISIEIPIEAAPTFVAAFGTPNPATTIPVAIARLQEPDKQLGEKPKRSWSEMPRSQQAGIACQDSEFQRYLADVHGHYFGDGLTMADAVRIACLVDSRSVLDNDPNAARRWDKLYSDYQLWRRGAAA